MTDSAMPDIAVSESSGDTKKSRDNTSTFWDKVTLFFVKTLIVAGVFYFATQLAVSSVSSTIEEQLWLLRGGPGFWHEMETKLNNFADQPDMPEWKKKRIIESLHKISVKYRPFIEALKGSDDPK